MKPSRSLLAFLAAVLLPVASVVPGSAAEPASPSAGSDVEPLAAVTDNPGPGALYRGKLYFSSRTDAAGDALWVTDGTPAGTQMAVDVQPGAADGAPRYLVVFQDRLYFVARGNGLGDEWWSTDGTQAGTQLLADIYPGTGASEPREPVVVGDRLYFSATDGNHGRELWSTGGTAATTKLAADVWAGPSSGDPQHLTSLDDRLVFSAQDRSGVVKPWVTVAGVFGAERLDSAVASQSLEAESFARIGAKVVFAARDPDHGTEVWVTGGRPADAQIARDIYAGPDSSYPDDLTPIGGLAVFQATSGRGEEVWATDGTTAGTFLVHDINPDGSSGASGFTVLGDEALFAADDGAHGTELWATKGSPGTSRLVSDVYAGPASGLDGRLGSTASAAGELLFTGIDAAGREPWTTDGTAAGTRRLSDFAPGVATSWPTAVGTVGNRAVFGAYSGTSWTLYAWTAMGSTTSVRAKKQYSDKQARKKRIVLPVRVVDEDGVALTGGAVTLTRKGKKIGSAQLVDGRARVRIKVRLRAGRKHRVVAVWSGSTSAAGSISAVEAFKVKVGQR